MNNIYIKDIFTSQVSDSLSHLPLGRFSQRLPDVSRDFQASNQTESNISI